MISFYKKLDVYKLKAKSYKLDRGMTYVELIVVLGIFSLMTSVVLFNHNSYEANVDIKILANDIALKIVEAQKASMSGKLPISGSSSWRPSYGVYFSIKTDVDKKSFVYFVDNNPADRAYVDGMGASCVTDAESAEITECLDKVSITKGNYIKELNAIDSNGDPLTRSCPIKDLNIVFVRPDSDAFLSNIPNTLSSCIFDHIEIVISSDDTNSATAKILVYPSGRIQIK